MTQMIDIKLKWLEDALSESTRKARRNLLAIGGSAVFLIKGELMPSKISGKSGTYMVRPALQGKSLIGK